MLLPPEEIRPEIKNPVMVPGKKPAKQPVEPASKLPRRRQLQCVATYQLDPESSGTDLPLQRNRPVAVVGDGFRGEGPDQNTVSRPDLLLKRPNQLSVPAGRVTRRPSQPVERSCSQEAGCDRRQGRNPPE